jgi:hypothetical protein
MSRTVSPPVEELDRLRQPLQKGERKVFELFHRLLPEAWEIYLQPRLNGLCPDFVLLNPSVGIAVFEVKDWDLDAMDYRVEPRGKNSPPELRAVNDGREFSRQRTIRSTRCGSTRTRYSTSTVPVSIGEQKGWSSPPASSSPTQMTPRFMSCSGRVADYHDMLHRARYYPLAGRDACNSGDITRVFPEGERTSSKFMSVEIAADLRQWLREPDAPSEQRRPLPMDHRQKELAMVRTYLSGYRRIKGPAGSGKSLVLAARAANLAREGKKVLVIGFNITLLNYLADLAVREYARARLDITWLNFHTWCKRVCMDADRDRGIRKPALGEGRAADF